MPRTLLQTLWMLHRAAHRLSGGRFGLSQPAAGGRFGMMRLATVGRRSGKVRVAIVGYYEDGPNLVTMAMNGWGKADPAWWLNLQANPNATVGLAHASRAMRARVATGAERDRLWAGFDEFPGWGDNIDALAARRPTETAVVVLEPLPDGGDRLEEALVPPDGEGEQRASCALSLGSARSRSEARRLPRRWPRWV